MKAPRAPRLDERRAPEFSAELQERARAWIPEWGLTDGEHDFGRALLEIAARFNSEVAERLDVAGEKMRRGFLDWLAVRGEAARPARMPVVFKLSDTATEGVLASAPVRMQADAAGTPVVFETEDEVQIVPGTLEVVVGVDGAKDAFYLPPPGLSDLKPLEPLPTEWQLRSFASSGATVLQLDPESGLVPEMILEAAGQQYRIVKVEKDLVTIEPPLVGGLAPESGFTKVSKFSPFDDKTRNQQQHALYLGDSELLNIEAEAEIEVVGASELQEDFVWQYWGKLEGKEELKWQSLTLDPTKQKSGSTVLTKPKGAIEEFEVGGKKSRWIRAFTTTIPADAIPLTVDFFSLKINSLACGKLPTQCPPVKPVESPKAEALANSSPLVLDNIFLPFGREPRQFDAFYLGSAEAFSKKGAQVRICFELADPTFESLAAVRGTGQFAGRVFAGVGRDRALHLFQFSTKDGSSTVSKFLDRDALRPPIPGDSGVIPPETKPRLVNPACKPVITALNDDFYVSVASSGTIWTWHEKFADGKLSGWQSPDQLPIPQDTAQLDDLICVNTSLVPTVVLSSGRLWVRSQTAWSEMSTEIRKDPDNPVPVKLVALVPILKGSDLNNLVAEINMVGVSNDNKLYQVATDGACTLLPLEDVDAGTTSSGATVQLRAIRPAAVKFNDTLVVVTASKDLTSLVMFQKKDGTDAVFDHIPLPQGDLISGAGVELSFVTGKPQFSVLCKTPAGSTYVASWQPAFSDVTVKKYLFRSVVSNLGTLGGAPVTLRSTIVVPGVRGDLFIAPFFTNERHVIKVVNPREGAVLPSKLPLFLKKDALSVVRPDGITRIHREIAEDAIMPSNSSENALYPVTSPFGDVAPNPEFLGYRVADPPSSPFVGQIKADVTKMELDANDQITVVGTVLLIKVDADVHLYTVVDSITGTNPRVAKLDRKLPAANKATDYWTPEALKGRVAAMLDIDAVDGNWLAEYVAQARLYFPSPIAPNVQRATAFGFFLGVLPRVIALDERWTTAPAVNTLYVLDATLGDWQHLLADTTSNPELSWEYSNGTAWESLILEEESTLNFKNTGAIRFTVPKDLAAVDWAGKTNHWIRARLIGGDYGREEVSVQTKDGNKQIVVRDTSGIHAPAVVRLHISYGFCDEIRPTFVLAKDSGTIRDQSDANRTPGAIVEAFVPLALTLGRLIRSAATIEPVELIKNNLSNCDCEIPEPTAAETKTTAGRPSRNEEKVTARELYIGLAATPSEAPVNVLLLVDEHDHTKFAPLKIETLIADRFESIVANDATRALGESGVLSMSFPIPPTRSEMFGTKNLTWLRLIPKSGETDEWKPTLRGAYLNAAWATATETLTRELLGSSNGEPNLTVHLARPPVLRDTLELRVKEPLGEEERNELLRQDAKSVLSTVEGLPGDWVLWTKVVDPDDEVETARVYSLDETTGEIRFGDGRHGKIPPIGRDSIVAFTYGRTEPDPTGGDKVPGNTIEARNALNLISPVETVESVTVAEQAAGGAPTESDDRVLRFGFARLRHRSRAVSAEDLEDLALQSSPDIVQAHAFVRLGYIRLVVVMRGKNPVPSAAQVRELRRVLLDAAPASLSATNALRIEGPKIRKLRIELVLQVETLDHAGQLSSSVKKKLSEFFDTATGGLDKDGWELGAKPSEEDIALAIGDAPYLESIENVELHEITEDGMELSSLKETGSREIVMLADDPIRIQFETAEVTV